MVSLATFALLLVAGFSATGVYSASPARIQDFASMVQMETGYGRAWLQTCVGSVLTSRYILTAAHCLLATVLEPRSTRVRAGATERGRDGQIIGVESAIRHPTYNFLSFDGNVGLVRLVSSLTFSSTVQQASIPTPGVVFPANVPLTLAGWGRTAQNVIWSNRDLYSSELYTIDHSACVADYASLRIPIEVTDNMICSTIPGTSGTHAGLRDGGAPVYYNGILVGFVSFGSPYGENYPLVATAISPFTEWIVENVVV